MRRLVRFSGHTLSALFDLCFSNAAAFLSVRVVTYMRWLAL